MLRHFYIMYLLRIRYASMHFNIAKTFIYTMLYAFAHFLNKRAPAVSLTTKNIYDLSFNSPSSSTRTSVTCLHHSLENCNVFFFHFHYLF